MPRPKAVNPKLEKKLHLDAELVAKAELQLFSDLEGRVPYGAWSGYIEQLMRQHFEAAKRRESFQLLLARWAELSPADHEACHREAEKLMVTELEAHGYNLSAFKGMKKYYA